MKGFFKWFSSSTKMKRWIALGLVGIVLVRYGVASILVTKEISFLAFLLCENISIIITCPPHLIDIKAKSFLCTVIFKLYML